MSTKSPVYPMPESQHFSDYGFDPITHYFEFVKDGKIRRTNFASSPDGFHFKLQKFVPVDQGTKVRKKKPSWKNFMFCCFSAGS